MSEWETEFGLPKSNIQRVLKNALPTNVPIGKEAKSAISIATTLFCFYHASMAMELSVKHKKLSVSATDMLDSLKEMGFEQFVEPINEFLQAYKLEKQNKTKRKQEDASEEGPTKKARLDGENTTSPSAPMPAAPSGPPAVGPVSAPSQAMPQAVPTKSSSPQAEAPVTTQDPGTE